jgi:hypothetical protein
MTKYIGYSILIGGLFWFLIFSFLVYLNGGEPKDYYRIFLSQLKVWDHFVITFIILLFSVYFCLSNYDTIVNNINNFGKEKVINKPSFTFTLNINRKNEVDYHYKEDSTKYYPNMDYSNISKKK